MSSCTIQTLLFLLVVFNAVYSVHGKRGASNRIPLGKFRVSNIAKAKSRRPLSGPPSLTDVELIEERKAVIQKKLAESEEKMKKVKEKRLERHNRKMRVKDLTEKKMNRIDDVQGHANANDIDGEEEELPFSLQRTGPEESTSVEAPRSQRLSGPSSLKRLLATRGKHRKM